VVVVEENIIPTDPIPPASPPPPQLVPILKIIQNDPAKVFDFEDLFGQDFPEGLVIGDYTPIPFIDIETELPPPEYFPEVMPEPIGGFEAMYDFLRANLTYPKGPRENFISGQVFIQFVVEKDGSISEVKVLSSVHPELDKEAIRVVKMMPKWNPGKQKGKAVRCYYQIPIRFSIN